MPNLVTLIALCLGVTSIIFAIKKDWQTAILLIFFAGLLDGVDGRLARFLSTSSPFGAELDSLCDFVNFGIAPGLLNYFWIINLKEAEGSKVTWCLSLIYCACMAIRLARFNTSQDTNFSKKFFLGVPAPCCAILILSPIAFNIDTEIFSEANIWIYQSYTLLISFLCSSTIPTFSIKSIAIKQKYLKFFLFLLMCLFGLVLINVWLTFSIFSLIYLATIPISWYKGFMMQKELNLNQDNT